MDGERFDRLTRSIATGVSRRSLLKAALIAGSAMLLGRPARGRSDLQGDCSAYVGVSCRGDGDCGPVGSVPICPHLGCCGGVCTDITFDDSNCGSCGAVCFEGSTCESGQCASTCQQPLMDCGGTCVDTSSDPQNCGDCFAECGVGTTCEGGTCACEGNLTNCFGFCVDTTADPGNCGDCGVACPEGTTCTNGQCDCVQGLSLCEGTCVDLATDATNCGACGVTCDDGGKCRDGTCEAVCPAGTEVCDGACVDTMVDTANCGGCGNRCTDGTQCVDGQCPASESSETTQIVRYVPGPEFCVAAAPPHVDLRRIALAIDPTPKPGAAPPSVLTPAEADAMMANGAAMDGERQDMALATVRGALGCENASDPLRELGGMTEDGMRAVLAERGWTPEIIDMLEGGTTFVPLPTDQRVGMAGPVSVGQLPDGRLAVRFPFYRAGLPSPGPQTPTPDTSDDDGRVYILAEDSGRMLIDRVVIIDPSAGTATKLSGSLAVQMEICPPGMTYDDFDPASCEPTKTDDYTVAMYAKPGDFELPLPYDVSKSYFGEYQSTSVPGMTYFDPPWSGFYFYAYELQLGRTYWLELATRTAGEDVAGVIPGTTGVSVLTRKTNWGVSLTTGRRDVVVRAYVFQ